MVPDSEIQMSDIGLWMSISCSDIDIRYQHSLTSEVWMSISDIAIRYQYPIREIT